MSNKASSWVGQTASSFRSYPNSADSSPKAYSNYAASGVSTGSSPVTAPKPAGELRRLSEKELQEKRARGLCFKCDGKWSTGHKCQRRELSILLTQDDGSGEEETGSLECPREEETGQEIEVHPEISLNSVVGLTSPKTFKLKEEVNGSPVVVIIDPGATHNFIALQAVQQLGVDCRDSQCFGVSLGMGETVQSQGECKSVILQLQGLTIIEDFLPIALGNSDLILGLQWLEKLGTMTTNWKSQTLKFKMGKMVTLKGDASLGRTGISLKAMIKTMRKAGGDFLVEFNHLGAAPLQSKEEQEASKVLAFLVPTMQKYQSVFEMPAGLPPYAIRTIV